MGDYRSGLAYLQQALRIARTLTSHQGRAALQATASCLLDLSILYSRQAAYGAALRYAQQASEQFAQLNDATGQANAEYRVAKRALQLGDTAQAGGAAHASLRRAGVSNQRSDRRDACDIFGLLAFARHQLVAARTWHQEALQIDQELGPLRYRRTT